MIRLALLAALALPSIAFADEPQPAQPPEDPAPPEPVPDVTPPEPEPEPEPEPAPEPAPIPVLIPTLGGPSGSSRDPAPSCPADIEDRKEEARLAATIKDPRARPYFVKGELAGIGSVRPQTRRSFIGVAGGIAGLPSGADTALNSFFLTVEPQLDIVVRARKNVKIGLSVPLQFQLIDTRAAFERCLSVARTAKDSGSDQPTIVAMTADCIDQERDSATDDAGKLREHDWDETSDFAKVIRYVTAGGEEQPFYLNVSRLYAQSVGHGATVRRYNPNLDYNTARLGVTFDAYQGAFGFESILNDIVKPDVLGLLAFVRPLEPFFPDVTLLRSLSFGGSVSLGLDVPRRMGYERGLFEPSIDLPIPQVNGDLDLVALETDKIQILGLDAEAKIYRSQRADLKVYADVEQIVRHGRGYTAGALLRLSLGSPAAMALRVRGELTYHDPDYLPSFFDSFYDIHKKQYFPSGYVSPSTGLTYYPTKLGYLEANAGGKDRAGFYLDATHSFINLLTAGIALRGSVGVGDPRDAGFTGPAFDDLGACPWNGDELDCGGVTPITVENPGYSSLLLHAEIPFRRFLQAFVTYEIFSTSVNDAHVMKDLFQLDGENEILFSGVRLQLLPILFVQAEARRFYFLQRLTNVDIDMLKLEQDQNYHSEWTFAINLNAGYEF